MVWTQQPGEDLTRRVAFPHLFGESSSPLLEYESEVIPQELFQSPKLVITLKPLSKDHWNIVSDLVLPLTQSMLQQQREAKQAALCLEEGSEGAEASPTEASVPGKSLPVEAEGSWGGFSLAASDRYHTGDLRMRTHYSPPDYV